MFTWWLWRETGIDPILASVVTTPLMFGFGWILYRLVISRIRDQSPSMSVLLTFGLALVIEGVLNVVGGQQVQVGDAVLLRGVLQGRARSRCPRPRCTASSLPSSSLPPSTSS